MRIIAAVVAVVVGLWTGQAWADDQVHLGAPASWVKLSGPLKAAVPDDGAALRFLRYQSQLHVGPEGVTAYGETAVRLQTPEGLQAMSTLTIPWDPALSSIVVHKVQVLRGGETIDVLAKQKFTVVRRETNLEAQQLDGELTAVLQPEDLRVGDTIVFAYSTTTRDPALAGHVQWLMVVPNLLTDELRLNLVSDQKPVFWRASEGIDGVKPDVTVQGKALSVVMDDVQPILLPSSAPGRFGWGRMVQITDFKSWSEVSSLMSGLFDKAVVLKPASPLQAEIDRIKAASTDPKTRAELALALVENQVRYVNLSMDDGGYIPADADATWSRRFGDCKGKTVLLLSLLKGLGIDAQPALVSSQLGDGMDTRLPSVGSFDHVIVRASIGGKTWWLDGTRLGDRKLEDAPTPSFGWALPLQAASATLVRLMPGPLDKPNSILTLKIDASAGLDIPAPAHVEALIRGDAAFELNTTLANFTPAQRETALRQYWTKTESSLTVTRASATYDPVAREERIVADGVWKMDWQEGQPCCRLYEADGYIMGWKADFDRPAGPHSDAPFAAVFPSYEQRQETVVLPYRGAGFTFQGKDVDTTIGAWTFHRKLRLEKGVFAMEASTRSLAPEFTPSATDAQTLKDMAKVGVYVVSPKTYQLTRQELDQYETKRLVTFKDYLDRAEMMVRRGRYARAKTDLDKAVALDAKSATAKALLAEIRAMGGDIPGARAALKDATVLAPDDLGVLRSSVYVAYLTGDRTAEIDGYDRLVAKSPQDAAWLVERGSARAKRGDLGLALADAEAALKIDPKNARARNLRISTLLNMGRGADALAVLEAAVAAEPKSASLHQYRASVLWIVKGEAEAQAEYDATLALDKTAAGYVRRSDARPLKDYKARLADIGEALKLKPDYQPALTRRALYEARLGQLDQAVAHIEALAAEDADTVSMRESRAQVYALAGKTDQAVADMDWVRNAIDPTANNLNNFCYDEAKWNLALTKALADCDKAVDLSHNEPVHLDSRAFVLLRLGRIDEALAVYDRTLELSPYQADSRFGRGVARLRKGLLKEGQADLAAARAANPQIDEVFAQYGVSAPQTVASSNSATK